MKDVFNNLKKDTDPKDFNKFNLNDKIQLFDMIIEEMCSESSKVKVAFKPAIRNLFDTFKKVVNENKQLRENQQNQRYPSSQQSQINSKFESYAKAARNEIKQNTVIIKKLEKSEENGNLELDDFDLKDETMRKLNLIKTKIDVTKIKVTNNNVIINTKDEEQLKLIKKELEKDKKLKVNEPMMRIPSVMIKEIDKSLTEERVITEICESNNVNRKDCKVIKFITDPKFRTNRMLINFRMEDTKRLVEQNYVKIGYMCCPIETRCKLIHCHCCLKFGHRYKDVDGKITCRSNIQKCSHCAGDHKYEDCQVKNDSTKAKCIHCNGNHGSTYGKCPKRMQVLDNLKAKCIC